MDGCNMTAMGNMIYRWGICVGSVKVSKSNDWICTMTNNHSCRDMSQDQSFLVGNDHVYFESSGAHCTLWLFQGGLFSSFCFVSPNPKKGFPNTILLCGSNDISSKNRAIVSKNADTPADKQVVVSNLSTIKRPVLPVKWTGLSINSGTPNHGA